MDKYETPISPENFDRVWEYTVRKYRQAKRCLIISRLVVPAGNLIFLFLSLALSWRIAHAILPRMNAALELVPVLPELWSRIPEFLPAVQGWQRLGLYLAVCYGAALLPSLILALLVRLIYHPIAPRLPDRGDALNAAELRSLALKARSCVNRSGSNFSTVCIAVYFIALFCMLAACVLLDPAGAGTLGQIDPLTMTVGGMGMFMACAVLSWVLQVLLQAMYHCRVSKELIADVQHYYNSFEENVQADLEADEIEALYKYAGR